MAESKKTDSYKKEKEVKADSNLKTEEVQKEGDGLSNSQKKDSSGKLVFGDNNLCAQFLRGYTNIPQFKNVQPEDIEDVTERYVHMFVEERNSDVVKKVKIKGDEIPFYLISLIEHKSEIDYNCVMQIFRYMAFIWEDYEKIQNKKKDGISKTKGFRYPPILPIIFYDGDKDWTAALQLKERIYLSDMFAEYIPDYKCMLIQVQNYSNQEIMEKRDEFSILMLINKLHGVADFRKLEEEVSPEYLKMVTENAPGYLLKIMAEVISGLLVKLNLSQEEVDDFTGQIRERKMGDWCSHFKGYDVPATRREAKLENAREFVLELLGDIGEIEDSLKNRIMCQNDIEVLKDMLKKANNSKSIEEFESKILEV